MTLTRKQYLMLLGLDRYMPRPATKIVSPTPSWRGEDWDTLRHCVGECKACPLHMTRTQTVFGRGSQQARLMVIGEAPGFHEDQQGQPFVGRAGKLLDAMLAAIGLDPQSIYIANILKCRPPSNRDPLKEEVQQCTPFLIRQIALLKPTLLLAVGRIAAHFLLENERPLSHLRQTIHTYGKNSLPLIVTYHPAYLLRNPKDKAKAWLDLQLAAQTLDRH